MHGFLLEHLVPNDSGNWGLGKVSSVIPLVGYFALTPNLRRHFGDEWCLGF